MKILILSDIHVEFEKFSPPIVDCDLVILAGDIHVKNKGLKWAKEKFQDVPVLYVLGNHEYYGEALPRHINKLKEQAEGSNINVLENESIKIGGIHTQKDYIIGNTRIICNPRGYPDEPNDEFVPDFVVEV